MNGNASMKKRGKKREVKMKEMKKDRKWRKDGRTWKKDVSLKGKKQRKIEEKKNMKMKHTKI